MGNTAGGCCAARTPHTHDASVASEAAHDMSEAASLTARFIALTAPPHERHRFEHLLRRGTPPQPRRPIDGHLFVHVIIPQGCQAGSQFRFQIPGSGGMMQVRVPNGYGPGMRLRVAYQQPESVAGPPAADTSSDAAIAQALSQRPHQDGVATLQARPQGAHRRAGRGRAGRPASNRHGRSLADPQVASSLSDVDRSVAGDLHGAAATTRSLLRRLAGRYTTHEGQLEWSAQSGTTENWQQAGATITITPDGKLSMGEQRVPEINCAVLSSTPQTILVSWENFVSGTRENAANQAGLIFTQGNAGTWSFQGQVIFSIPGEQAHIRELRGVEEGTQAATTIQAFARGRQHRLHAPPSLEHVAQLGHPGPRGRFAPRVAEPRIGCTSVSESVPPAPEPEAQSTNLHSTNSSKRFLLQRQPSPAARLLGIKRSNLNDLVKTLQKSWKTYPGRKCSPKTLEVEVDRKNLLQSLLRWHGKLLGKTWHDGLRICDELRVKFKGEEGIDEGGISKDFFASCSHALVAVGAYDGQWIGSNLFSRTLDNGYVFELNPKSGASIRDSPDLRKLLELFGWLLARALVQGIFLDVHFSRAFYSCLLGLPVVFHDLESVDKSLYDSLEQTLRMPPEEVEFLCFSFEVPDSSALEAGATHELKPGGRDIEVTAANREEFVKLWATWVLQGCVADQMSAIKYGFEAALPLERLKSLGFNGRELEATLCGVREISIEDWQQHAVIKGNHPASSTIVQRFWRVLSQWDNELLCALLRFTTGTPALPPEGFVALEGKDGPQPFSLQVCRWDVRKLPQASTCYNLLMIPPYSTDEMMAQKLEYAALESAGGAFGLR